MIFADINELPPWLKSGVTLLAGAGVAKLLAVWLENKRLEKSDYRDTLVGRIRELEDKIDEMHATNTRLAIKVNTLEDDLEECKRLHADRRSPA
jgi:cell division protein FtsB